VGELPKVLYIAWDYKKDGSVEAWHSPEGIKTRAGRTYIGRIGVRAREEWSQLSPAELSAATDQWVAEKRAAKGL